jgi:hypothetical protein
MLSYKLESMLYFYYCVNCSYTYIIYLSIMEHITYLDAISITIELQFVRNNPMDVQLLANCMLQSSLIAGFHCL